jgi:hypothetical protein
MCRLGLSIMSQKSSREKYFALFYWPLQLQLLMVLWSLWSEVREIASGKNLGYNDGLNWW